jgi:hypothetical protein
MRNNTSESHLSRPLSRRSLLKLTGLATGALFLAACEMGIPGVTDETPVAETDQTPIPT